MPPQINSLCPRSYDLNSSATPNPVNCMGLMSAQMTVQARQLESSVVWKEEAGIEEKWRIDQERVGAEKAAEDERAR